MKPVAFEYLDPTGVDEVLAILAEHGDEAKPLAGGQSLVPLLNFRLARPRYLIDLNRIDALSYVREDHGGLAVGAMTRQRTLERSLSFEEHCPLIHEAMPFVGHFQIRGRGTIGGSLAHADPAAELPAALVALGGSVVARRAGTERVIPADAFFVSSLTTILAADELLAEVRLPATEGRTGTAFLEASRRHGDFALVGVAAVVTLDADGVCRSASVAFAGVGPTPVRAEWAEPILAGVSLDQRVFDAVATAASQRLAPEADIHASAEYRKHLAGVLVARALAIAAARANRLA